MHKILYKMSLLFLENIGKYDLSINILPLLYKIVHTRCIDFIRHLNAEHNYISSQLVTSDTESNEDVEYNFADYQDRMNRVTNGIKNFLLRLGGYL